MAVDDKLLFATQEQYNKLNAGKLKYNDTVLCIRGSIGKHGRFQFNVGAISSSLVIIRPYVTQDLAEYLGFYLDSNIFTLEVTKYNNGTAQPNLAAADLKKFIIPLPPLPEQQRIVSRIDALMKEIDELEQTEKELEAIKAAFPGDMKASLLQAAMEGKLTEQKAEDGDARGLLLAIRKEKEKLVKEKKGKREKPLAPITDEEIPFDIPENWVWCRLAEICTKLVDGDHNPPKGTNKKTPYIMASSKNINNDKLVNLESVRYLSKEVFEKENQRTQAKAGDIFFTSVGSLGRSCVYNENINICFQRSVSVITTLAYNYFLKYCFDSPAIQNKVLKEATGTAQKGFYLNQLAAMAIPLPPLAEQHRIVEKLDQLLPLCDSLSEH